MENLEEKVDKKQRCEIFFVEIFLLENKKKKTRNYTAETIIIFLSVRLVVRELNVNKTWKSPKKGIVEEIKIFNTDKNKKKLKLKKTPISKKRKSKKNALSS